MNVLILIFAAIGVFAFACMIAFFIALAIDARRETQVQDYMQVEENQGEKNGNEKI